MGVETAKCYKLPGAQTDAISTKFPTEIYFAPELSQGQRCLVEVETREEVGAN